LSPRSARIAGSISAYANRANEFDTAGPSESAATTLKRFPNDIMDAKEGEAAV